MYFSFKIKDQIIIFQLETNTNTINSQKLADHSRRPKTPNKSLSQSLLPETTKSSPTSPPIYVLNGILQFTPPLLNILQTRYTLKSLMSSKVHKLYNSKSMPTSL